MNKLKLLILVEGIYLKNHMIKFDPNSLSLLLYDLKGVLLNKMYIYYLIDDICIIDDNFILVRNIYNMLIKIKIINNTLENEDILFIKYKKIYDFIYIKESKLLIISFSNFIGIWDIDSLNKNPIQIIKNNSPYLLNFNSNLFISYDNKNISIYQNTNNIKLYQLSSILTLDIGKNKLYLIKLDNRTLMASKKNEIYLIDIRNMMTKKKYKFINGKDEIKYLYKKNKDIFLNNKNYLYKIRYNNYNLETITKIETTKYEREREKEIKKYLFERPYSIRFESAHFFNDKDSIKFYLYKHEIFNGNSIQMLEERLSLPSYEIIEAIESAIENRRSQLFNEIKIIDEDKIGKRIEIKNSKNYPKIIGKISYDKRKDTFKKTYEIRNEKITNNPKNFKKKFR